jgi:hypothetical protein
MQCSRKNGEGRRCKGVARPGRKTCLTCGLRYMREDQTARQRRHETTLKRGISRSRVARNREIKELEARRGNEDTRAIGF